ncbi:MAG: hypothetical protein V9G19_05315 [Tetrasphaera sp.]
MITPPLDYAVYVADQCMARFVYTPDAAHYRQQLIHRIRDQAPDLGPAQIAAGVTVEESPHESLRRQAVELPVQVWLVWEGQQLLGVHSTREGAEAALEMQRGPRQGDLGERTASLAVTAVWVAEPN